MWPSKQRSYVLAYIGLYDHLLRPEAIGITKAWQLLPSLREGQINLNENWEAVDKLLEGTSNERWKEYQLILGWIANLLQACNNNKELDITKEITLHDCVW